MTLEQFDILKKVTKPELIELIHTMHVLAETGRKGTVENAIADLQSIHNEKANKHLMEIAEKNKPKTIHE